MTPPTRMQERATPNPLRALVAQGQSVWLDYIRRSLLTSGELARLIEEDGVRGLTSNPTIFEKAIAGSTDYEASFRQIVDEDVQLDANGLYERLAIADIRAAADALTPVYEESQGEDGYVSMEVSPLLAADTAETVREAHRLWDAVERPNLMIKVPATNEGMPALEQLIGDGINVNVTLMFSLAHYEAVAKAYLRGIARCRDPENVASVASFFVSRIDTAVDRELEKIGTPEARALRGTIAVANAKRVYRRFQEIFLGAAFADLRRRGARVQRVLWASTGTKDPAYSDVLYVEELIGAHTVNTMPPATLHAFRDHGRVRPRLTEDIESETRRLEDLARLGVDLDAVAAQLQEDGVSAFAGAFTQLMMALEEKRRSMLARPVATQDLRLGPHAERLTARLEQWHAEHVCRRIWQKDPTVWSEASVPELGDRLGWLDLPETMSEQVDDLTSLAAQIEAESLRHVVLLGMGGSSLAPEVFASTFGSAPGYPTLLVLDSTHPSAVADLANRIDVRATLFVVSSKSGTTLETLSLFRAFWERVGRVNGDPGRQFIAITDPGSSLETLAQERGFRHTLLAPPTVGGRYSALSLFGLAPAALVGVDVGRLIDCARTMAEASTFCVDERGNPGLELGAALGELALAGVDKVTFLTSPGLATFPAWLEQLIAESTGKDGVGIVPVESEPDMPVEWYTRDRVFVLIALNGDDTGPLERRARELESAGYPTVVIRLSEKADLGQEIFRWELAVAAASAALGIHPFNQPDVQLAKDLARKAMAADKPAGETVEAVTIAASDRRALDREIARWAVSRPGDYVSIQAYLPMNAATTAALQDMRAILGTRLEVATTLGYGPRFLHSTGQLHKGGANTGLFLQIVDEPEVDVAVPETDYTFGALIRAQALGDFEALRSRERRVLRVNLGSDVEAGLVRLRAALES